jgi:hypothetical protein
MFYDLFTQEPLKEQYHYFFIMNVAHMVPVRPGWIEAIYQHIVTDGTISYHISFSAIMSLMYLINTVYCMC